MHIPFPPESSPWPRRLLVLLFGLIPYLAAALTGTPDPGAVGLARIHSAARSVYCGKGGNLVTTVLVAELILVGVLVLLANHRGEGRGFLASLRGAAGWRLLALLVLMAMPFLIGWNTGTSVCTRGKAYFWQSIFVEVFILAILAISYNLLFGFTGVISFGHAAFFGTGAYSVGLLMLHLSWPWWLAVAAALLIGVILALVKGFVGLRIKGLYFALFTLALAEVLFLLAGNRILVNITGAEDGFTFTVPDWLNMTRNRLFFYYLALGLFVGAFALVQRLMGSPTGHALHAIRDNEERAQMIGYNTFRFKLIAIALSGFLATLAGVMRGIALKGASPNVLGLDFTMQPLLMTIVGGMGTFSGPVVGAFVLRLLEQLLRDSVLTLGPVAIDIGERWPLILGLIFILSVMAFPYGIVGTWLSKGLHTREGWRRLLGGKGGGKQPG